MEPELRLVKTRTELESAKSVRHSVFVIEQNVPIEIEMDEYDALATHMICLLNGKTIGTGRLVRMQDGMKLGRVAVLPGYRKKGLGAEIVKWLLAKAGEMGTEEVYANVQMSALAFYEELGFRAVGDEFLEAGIEHVRMVRALD
ncbi:MAG: GNAT family N-acetyltransferase [Candidatus Thermoplasmatota archaeon]|nr:GNAT family N-acetyltransferase [Euryarchaeota archaeon]MBU4031888.1 GNAT family N-acetyltransferase [Candidatus Thermoplasmatota archaeon]MBU4072378.1 GNAT family N-acetyltransferase [Candidatus Thermoplasmatota archaeon]MBU4144084.1 GNAT family N-acetyltransferase [Candidatus Thermoplasmatota archaeon]MBU4590976.1 GNAT family N-acetyltransferase [Candidatus Thermoplasmatota archaeon]